MIEITENAKREVEIVKEWMARSEGIDSRAIKAMSWSGRGDWSEADAGMHWSDNKPNI